MSAVGRLKSAERSQPLGARHLVGRRGLVQLRIESPTVSAEHASIYFDRVAWKLRDLGSRNGTFVNGSQIPVRQSLVLRLGDEIQFGGRTEPRWVLEDDSEPSAIAFGAEGQVIRGTAEGLWLPDTAEPLVRVQWTQSGWWLDSPDEARPVSDGEQIWLRAEPWTLELPPHGGESNDASLSTQEAPESGHPSLLFRVSQDEEHVDLEAHWGATRIRLGARAHNYVLLLLARRRIEDQRSGTAADETGWLYAQDLRQQLHIDRTSLNLQLWRAMQCASKAGLPGNQLIERRADSSQLRIGFESSIGALHGTD